MKLWFIKQFEHIKQHSKMNSLKYQALSKSAYLPYTLISRSKYVGLATFVNVVFNNPIAALST
jgi:hypothetical protein